jgi:hypothetical protein
MKVCNALGVTRPAVAIALLWVNFVWAQSVQQPIQSEQLGINEQYESNPNAVNTLQSNLNEQAPGTGNESAIARAITLRLAAGVGYDDNVFRTEIDTRSDSFWSLQPAAYLNGVFGKHAYQLGYEGNYAHYSEYSTENFDDHRFLGNLRLDLSLKLDLLLDAGYTWGHDPRGSLGNRLIVPGDLDQWQEYFVNTGLVIGREITRAQITPRIEFSGMRYTNNGQSIRDFDRQEVCVRGRWRFTPRLFGLADVGYTNIDHTDPSNLLDRTETEILVGFGWLATAKTSGEVMLGLLNRDFDDPREPSGNNLSWDIRINWAPKPYSKATAYMQRNSMENAGGVGSFLADTYGAEWNHAFTERLDLNTGINYTVADYGGSPRQDKYLAFEIGLTHELTRWLDIGASYQFLNRNSNLPGIDYDDQIIMLRLTAGVEHSLAP